MIDPHYVMAGFGVGILVGMTGVGGGSLMTPLLILVFGINPVTAVGTDLLFAAATKTAGTVVHGASRTVDWRVVRLLAAGSVPATILTLLVLSRFDISGSTARSVLTIMLGCVLLLTSLLLLFAGRIRLRYAERMRKMPTERAAQYTVILGMAIGLFVSTTSVGAGAIGVSALLLLFPQLPTARIVGSDIAHAVPLTVAAGIGHWFLGSIDWGLLGALLVGSIPGIIVGSYVAGWVADEILRIALALVLIAVAIKLVL